MKNFHKKAFGFAKDIFNYGRLYAIGTDQEIAMQENKMPEHIQSTVCFCTMLETFSCLPAYPLSIILASPYANEPALYASCILGTLGLSFLSLADGISRLESESTKVGVGSGLVGKIRQAWKKYRT